MQAAATSDGLYKNLVTQLSGMFFRFENGIPRKLISVSENCEKITGYSVNELLNHPHFTYSHLVHGEDLKTLTENFCDKDLKTAINTEYRIITKQGQVRWVKEYATGVFNEAAELLYVDAYLEDISSRKNSVLLNNTFNSYKHAINSGSIVSITDKTGKIIYVNDLFCNYSQYLPNELLGKNHGIVNSGYHPETFFKNLWETILSKKIWRGEIRNKSKDGTYYWVDTVICPVLNESDEIDQFLSIRNIITDKKNAEYKIRESEKRLNEAQQVAKIGSWELDLTTNRLTWSEECYKLFETDKLRFNGTLEAFLDLIYPLDRNLVEAAYAASLSTQSPYSIVHRVNLESGKLKYIHERCETFYSPEGLPLRSVGTSQDITEQRIKDDALRLSELQLKSTIEGSLDAFYLLKCVRNATGTVVDFEFSEINKKAEVQMNLSRKELIGKKLSEITALTGTTWFPDKYLKVFYTRLPVEEEYMVTKSSSSPGWYYHQIVPLPDGVAINNRNISERKQTEITLKENEVFIKGVLDSMSSPIAVIDESGLIIAVNTSWRQFAEENGHKNPDLVCEGSNYFAACENAAKSGDISSGRALEGIKSVLQGELTTFQLEYPCDSPTEKRWFILYISSYKSDQKKVVIRHVDITERKKNELLIHKSQEKYQRVVENISDGIIIVSATGKVLFTNNRIPELFGFEPEDLKNIDLAQLLASDNRESLSKRFYERLEEKDAPEVFEFKGLRKNGVLRWFEAHASLIREEGSVKSVQYVLRDITDSKNYLTELHLKEKQLEQLVTELTMKYNELMQFNYIVSHNLRAPIANILGLARIINASSVTEEEKPIILQQILHVTTKMDDLIKDLNLILSARSDLGQKKEKVEISEIFESILSILENQIKQADCKITLSIDKNAGSIFTIKSYFESILFNLISNAIKFRTYKYPEITISAQRTDSFLTVCVKDNGIGIDLSKHGQYLFGLYKRFNNSLEGKGLGLHMTKIQVEMLGGSIWADSTPGVGSSFFIKLPLEDKIVTEINAS